MYSKIMCVITTDLTQENDKSILAIFLGNQAIYHFLGLSFFKVHFFLFSAGKRTKKLIISLGYHFSGSLSQNVRYAEVYHYLVYHFGSLLFL